MAAAMVTSLPAGANFILPYMTSVPLKSLSARVTRLLLLLLSYSSLVLSVCLSHVAATRQPFTLLLSFLPLPRKPLTLHLLHRLCSLSCIPWQSPPKATYFTQLSPFTSQVNQFKDLIWLTGKRACLQTYLPKGNRGTHDR